MTSSDNTNALRDESLLFEAPQGITVEFPYRHKTRFIVRCLSGRPLEQSDVAVRLSYISLAGNRIRECVCAAIIRDQMEVNSSSVANKIFELKFASTIVVEIDDVKHASSIIVDFKFVDSVETGTFFRRDTIRLERRDNEDVTAPHSTFINVNSDRSARFLAAVDPGRKVFTARSAIGLRGLIMYMAPLNTRGEVTKERIELIAYMTNENMGALAIPRARRLERPERFNKEVVIPPRSTFIRGWLSPLDPARSAHFDVTAFKVHDMRRPVGMPHGVALFDQLSLAIHLQAYDTSREDFLSLSQQE